MDEKKLITEEMPPRVGPMLTEDRPPACPKCGTPMKREPAVESGFQCPRCRTAA